MTSVRFVGDVPLWLGLLLAVIVGVLSWSYYNRESYELPGRLKWLLPMLRSLAFFFGMLILTGPVLHHRKTIGELGRVQIYLDASESMTMLDRHMSTGRKLLVATELGWIEDGKFNARLLYAADQQATARQKLTQAISTAAESDRAIASDLIEYVNRLSVLTDSLPAELGERLSSEVAEPVKLLASTSGEENRDTIQSQLADPLAKAAEIEQETRTEFEKVATEIVNSGDSAIQAAMTLFDETPRWRRAELGLLDSQQVLSQLRERHDVKFIKLHGDLAEELALPTDESASNESLLADIRFARSTDLGTGIVANQKGDAANEPTKQEAASKPQTAIVLFSDGQHNSGPSPLQMSRVLGSQGVVFYPVSLGAEQHAPDLAIISLEHPDAVFQKDRVRGSMVIRDQMKAGTPFVAQIEQGDDVLWQQQLIADDNGERRIDFEFGVDELVEALKTQLSGNVTQHVLPLDLRASIVPLVTESETSNNQRPLRMAAILEKHKVLILDGRSRWETRYLRNVFERDEQWQTNTIIAGTGTDDEALPRGDYDGQFPANRDSLFEFDLIVLGEINARLFTERELEWLREFVEVRGGGLILIDGQRGELKSMAGSSLAALFPVEWLDNTSNLKPAALELTDIGAKTAAFTLQSESQANRQFWTQLPPPHSLVLVDALPGAEVLVDAIVENRQMPAIVSRRVGSGKVLYFAFDETWRWRYKAADTWHQRIWNQLAKSVMPRSFSVSDQYLSIDTGPVSYAPGEPVEIRTRLLGVDEKPATGVTAEALLWNNGRLVATVNLAEDVDVPGIYRGQTGELPEGEYEVSVRASGFSESALQARSRFVVLADETTEMQTTAANEELLRQMAEASNGVFLREEEIGQLPDLLSPLSSGRIVESETLIWQSYWWFAAIIALLTIEWILRKRAGLL